MAPDRPFSQSVMPDCAEAMGLPITTNIRNPTTAAETSGITTTGMMPRSAFGIGTRWIASTTAPEIRPAARPPRKPAADGQRDRAADEAGDRARPVGHAVGDVAYQHRDQEGEGHAADLEEQRRPAVRLGPHEVVHHGRRLVDLVAADREAQGDQQPARGDERDHVTDAGHQPLAELGAVALAGLAAALDGGRARGGGGDLAAGRLVADLADQLARPVDGGLDAGVDGGLPGEAALLAHGDVVGEDHAVRRRDHRRVEPGEAGRALRLDDDLDARLAARVLQRLGRHVGVRDAGGAGGDGDDAEGAPGPAGILTGAARGGLGGGRRRDRPGVRGLLGGVLDDVLGAFLGAVLTGVRGRCRLLPADERGGGRRLRPASAARR